MRVGASSKTDCSRSMRRPTAFGSWPSHVGSTGESRGRGTRTKKLRTRDLQRKGLEVAARVASPNHDPVHTRPDVGRQRKLEFLGGRVEQPVARARGPEV